MKVKIDNTQQNNKCRLCGDIDEMVNYKTSERYKLAEKAFKTRHNRVVKVIDLELWKKLKFDHSTKRYMQKPESVLQNEMQKIPLDFEIQTGHPILTRRPDLNKKKRTCRLIELAVMVDYRGGNLRDRQILRPCLRILKRLWNMSWYQL